MMYITFIFLIFATSICGFIEGTTYSIERWGISHGNAKSSQGECSESMYIYILVMYIIYDFDDFLLMYVWHIMPHH